MIAGKVVYKMGNMSYCRFENTRSDITECIEALEDRSITSITERRNAMKLLENILDFCINENIIDGYNSDRILEIIKECKSNTIEEE